MPTLSSILPPISLASTSGTLTAGSGGTGATTLTGVVKGNGAGVMTAGTVSLTTEVSGTLPVGSGGTGATTLAANNVLLGNGTSVLQAVAPGTTGNVLTSNGTTWASTAPAGGGFSNMVVFTSSGTWPIPAGVTKAKVTVVAGGGGGSAGNGTEGGNGGCAGGAAIKIYSLVGSTASITVGAAGSGGTSLGAVGGNGGTSSFVNNGVSCTASGGGGGAGPGTLPSANGGIGTGGDINFQGGWGGQGGVPVAAYGAYGAMGGSSIFGANGSSRIGSGSTVRQNANYGGGGGGGPKNTNAGFFNGGDGGNGIAIIEF